MEEIKLSGSPAALIESDAADEEPEIVVDHPLPSMASIPMGIDESLDDAMMSMSV